MNMEMPLEVPYRMVPRPFEAQLPRMTDAAAAVRRSIAQRQIGGDVTLFGQTWSVATTHHPLTGARTASAIICQIGQAEVTIAANSDLMDMLADHADLDDGMYQLEPTQRALVAEHLLSDELASLEDQFGTSIRVLRVEPDVTYDLAETHLRLAATTVDGDPITLDVWSDAPDALLTALTTTFPARPLQPLDDLKAQVKMLGPLSRISAKQCASLGVGALLQPAQSWEDEDNTFYLLAGNKVLAPLRYVQGEGVVVDGTEVPFTDLIKDHSQDTAMTATETKASLADPNILVTVELSRMDLPLSQLQMIQNGDVVDFDLSSVDVVTICTNGKPFAEGELVQLDGSVGVHIRKML